MKLLVAGIAAALLLPAQPGPAIGSPARPFSLPDQNGVARDLKSLTGPKGLMLVFYRSADW